MKLNHLGNLAIIAALVVGSGLSVLGPIASVSAQSENSQKGEVFRQLNLTPQQMQQLKTIRESNQDTMRSTREQLKQARKELQELLAGSASDSQVRQKQEQVQYLQQQAAKLGFDQMLAIRAVLTPQQRTQLAEAMKKRGGEMRQRFQNRNPNNQQQLTPPQ